MIPVKRWPPAGTASRSADPTGATATPSAAPPSQDVSAARLASGSRPSDRVTAAGAVSCCVPFSIPTETASPSPARMMPLRMGESVKAVVPGSRLGVGEGVDCATAPVVGMPRPSVSAAAARRAARCSATRGAQRGHDHGWGIPLLCDVRTARSGAILRSVPSRLTTPRSGGAVEWRDATPAPLSRSRALPQPLRRSARGRLRRSAPPRGMGRVRRQRHRARTPLTGCESPR